MRVGMIDLEQRTDGLIPSGSGLSQAEGQSDQWSRARPPRFLYDSQLPRGPCAALIAIAAIPNSEFRICSIPTSDSDCAVPVTHSVTCDSGPGLPGQSAER